jgi:hypothetical protein
MLTVRRKFSTIVTLLTSTVTAVSSPLISFNDSLDVYFTGSSNLSWQSNLFSDSSDEVEDILLILSPGFEGVFGRGVSNANLNFTTRYDILRYDKSDEWDTQTFHAKLAGNYNAAKYFINGLVSFDERQSSLRDAQVKGNLSESDESKLEVEGEYLFSPKFSFGSGIKFSKREYTGSQAINYADRDSTILPVDLFYELTPKVDLSIGYQYTYTDIADVASNNAETAYSSDAHFVNIGARGDLLPKLTGNIKLGLRFIDSDFANSSRDNSSLGLDGSLNWQTTPKLSNAITISRDFGSTSNGTRIEESAFNINSSLALSQQLRTGASLGYTLRDYLDQSREDGFLSLGLNASYQVSDYCTVSSAYSYSKNNSDLAGGASDFDNNKVDINISLRY